MRKQLAQGFLAGPGCEPPGPLSPKARVLTTSPLSLFSNLAHGCHKPIDPIAVVTGVPSCTSTCTGSPAPYIDR